MTQNAHEPVVKLSGAATLQIDSGIGRSKITIPRVNRDGENNADSLINEVLHFAVMRHGKNKLRQMAEEKLSGYESKYDDCGLTLDNTGA